MAVETDGARVGSAQKGGTGAGCAGEAVFGIMNGMAAIAGADTAVVKRGGCGLRGAAEGNRYEDCYGDPLFEHEAYPKKELHELFI